MRPSPLLACAAALILVACGSNVTTTTSSSGTGGTGGSSMVSTTDGAPATGGAPSTSSTASTTSSTGTGPLDGGMTCPSAGDACTTCLSTSCAGQYCDCYGNLDCPALFQCFKTCQPGDQQCLQGCDHAHQDGVSVAFLLSDCAATDCATDCPGNKQLTPCEKCLYTKCDTAMNSCAADAECVALFACWKTCAPNDMTCIQGCEAQHPNGMQNATKVLTCEKVSCPSACQ